MPPQAAPNPLAMLFPFLMMFLIFYLLVFRPQTQARKTHQQMLNELKKFDEVATTGGLLGTIVNMKTDTVTLRVDENVRIEVEKSAITRLVRAKGTEAESVSGEKKA